MSNFLRLAATRRALLAFLGSIVLTGGISAQVDAPPAVQQYVEYLAGERPKGRMTGSEGEKLASDFIIAELKEMGLKPHPDYPNYLQPFEFTSGVKPKEGANELFLAVTDDKGVRSERNFSPKTGFTPLSFSGSGEADAEVVFVGYGITTRPSDDFSYDSYQGLDVKDKIVLALRYSPEDADSDAKQILSRYAPLRQKAITARKAGAKALILVTGPRSENAGKLIETGFEMGAASMDIVAVSVSGDVGQALFDAAGKDLEEVQKELDTANPHAQGFAIPGAKLRLKAELEKERVTGHNILAIIPATKEDQQTTDIIAIGAHYDHLGEGKGGGSLGRGGELGMTHYGADDNASGTSAVLNAARLIVESSGDRRRDILVGFWSGEEIGLLGSAHYVEKPEIAGRPVTAYVNLDMVGRMKDNKLTIQGTGSSHGWAPMLEKVNVPIGFDLTVQEDPYQPSDSQSFYIAGVPALEFFTGLHLDYHRPTDTPDKINYEDLDRVSTFAAALTLDLARADKSLEYAKFTRKEQGRERGGMRAYTGTIPDYTREVKGMPLSGVAPGGPAEKAGLKGGDIIVQIGGASVTNIYDFMYALDGVKVGEATDVIVEREGKRVTLSITPTKRD